MRGVMMEEDLPSLNGRLVRVCYKDHVLFRDLDVQEVPFDRRESVGWFLNKARRASSSSTTGASSRKIPGTSDKPSVWSSTGTSSRRWCPLIKGFEEDHIIRLPRDLSLRIAKVLEEEALGYASFDDFVLSGIRHELKEAELASYWLKQEER